MTQSAINLLRGIVLLRPLTYGQAMRIAELQATRFLRMMDVSEAPVSEKLISEFPRLQVNRIQPSSGMGLWAVQADNVTLRTAYVSAIDTEEITTDMQDATYQEEAAAALKRQQASAPHSCPWYDLRCDLSKASGALTLVSEAAGTLAAVSSSLTFIPVVGTFAETVSVVAGLVAVVADAANCLGDHCNWIATVADMTAMIPGFGATHLSRVADEAAESVEAAKDVDEALDASDTISAVMKDMSSNDLADAETALAGAQGAQYTARVLAATYATAARETGVVT